VDRRQRAGGGIEPLVRALGLHDARGARPDDHRDAARPEPLPRGERGLEKAVLVQRELGEPVVAAVERGEVAAHGQPREALDLADERVELDVLERAGLQAGAPRDERPPQRVGAAAETGDGGEARDDERAHGKPRGERGCIDDSSKRVARRPVAARWPRKTAG
jgi:hypothetical protein